MLNHVVLKSKCVHYLFECKVHSAERVNSVLHSDIHEMAIWKSKVRGVSCADQEGRGQASGLPPPEQ